MTTVRTPSVLWGQRSSATTKQKNIVYLTVNLEGIIHSTLKYTVTDTTLSWKANAKEGDEQHEYAFELDFFAKVVPEVKVLEKRRTPQSVTIVIFKKDISAQDWPQLSKTVPLPYVKTDFSQWTWEGGDGWDEDGSTEIINLDMDSSSENGESLKSSNQGAASPTIKTPATPQVLWAQQSSLTEVAKNYICFSVNAPDIAESTLKCIVTETSVYFSAYAREEYEEREYALELDFYGDVNSEKVGKYLTEQHLIIIVLKKQMDTQDWPRLQKVEGVLPYINTGFKWPGTGDKDDDNISAETEIHSTGENKEQHLKKAEDFNNRGVFFLNRLKRLGDIEDLEKSISEFEDAVQLTPDGHEDKTGRLHNLGLLLIKRFKCLGEMGDVEMSILCLEDGVKLMPSSYANLPSLFDNLGYAYSCRFERTGELEDINCAIFHQQKAVEATPAGHANLPRWLTNLGNSYACRFKRTGDLEDIGSAISHHQKAMESISPGDLPSLLNNLGNSYAGRFKRTGDLADIDCAISHHQKVVESTPSDHPVLSERFNNLGNSYFYRFKRTGDLKDIHCAISYHQKAVESTPSGHPNLPDCFSNLGSSYACYFGRTGDLKDIDCAISHHQKALESTPSDHSVLPERFNNLGSSYLHRFEHTGDLEDIGYAISHHQKAVESTPSGHPVLPKHLNNLGNSYAHRFQRTGDLEDINCAISHHQKAVESTPPGHSDLPIWINNLGNSYTRRFERTGDLKDIHCAISHHQKAVESTPSGHPVLPDRFNNLGNSYLCCFVRTGDLEDIHCAISYHQKAVESTPSGHPNLLIWSSNLGNSYACRFGRTGDLKDIDCAISHHQKAVESTPSGHADLPNCLNDLGNSYLYRFERTGELEDIACAVSHYQKGVESTPPGHPDLPGRFYNLGNSYLGRFKCNGDLEDINHAMFHHQKAVDSTPPGHTHLASFFKSLGSSYACRFEHNHYGPDVQKSIASYRQGANTNAPPSIQLASAKHAAMLSSVHDSSQCLNDFDLSISLLAEVAGLEQTIYRRHANLQGHSAFVQSAVATALDLNEPDFALQWLEQGRCMVWNQINQLRSPIDNLRKKNPALADRFKNVASALESYGTRSILSISSSHEMLTERILLDDTQNHTLHAAEYKQLLEEIRSLPDFNDFLRPPKAVNILSSLPSDGPVIIFNVHKTRCDALALIAKSEGPLHIPLRDFSLAQAEEMQKVLQLNFLENREVEDRERAGRIAVDNPVPMAFILKELWHKMVQPILAALGYLVPPDPLNRPRIWWCPTGPLAFLPLHAAGIYGSAYLPGSCVSDFVVSSYTPTVSSINDKFTTSSTSSRCHNLLLISQPNTPGLKPIPSTRKETRAIEALMKGTAVDALLLEDDKATREKVKTEMKSHGWAHFACHGIQDVRQPLESGLCLYDGRLELIEIMKERIPNPDLVFFSACQTSKGDIKLSEEVVHLSAGMLAAGYRGVVGTMWGVSDLHGPDFATKFYQYLLREDGSKGLDSTRAAYALDYATRMVRETLGKDNNAFLTWVPYVHFGY